MKFNIDGRAVKIDDATVLRYRTALGLLPDMKTDDKWLKNYIEIAFKEKNLARAEDTYNVIFAKYNVSEVEDIVTAALKYEADTYDSLGGGTFM